MQTDPEGNIKCSQAWVSPEVYLHGRGRDSANKTSLSASYAIDVFSVGECSSPVQLCHYNVSYN